MKPLIRPAQAKDGLFWITGASSGIGRAVALAAAASGWRVLASARRHEELEALAKDSPVPGAILPAPCDVSDEAGVAALIEQIEAKEGVVARAFLNAGVFHPVTLDPFETAKYHASFTVNLGGTVNCLGAILPRMRARQQGQIAINASVAGYSGLPSAAAYGASKAGLINLCESLKFDCDRVGILLQVVNPGFVDTPATAVNPFPMPFLMPVEAAAKRVLAGMAGTGFEIIFPRRFAYIMKALRLVPYPIFFPMIARQTGWDKPL